MLIQQMRAAQVYPAGTILSWVLSQSSLAVLHMEMTEREKYHRL
jgi:hypothetical protein